MPPLAEHRVAQPAARPGPGRQGRGPTPPPVPHSPVSSTHHGTPACTRPNSPSGTHPERVPELRPLFSLSDRGPRAHQQFGFKQRLGPSGFAGLPGFRKLTRRTREPRASDLAAGARSRRSGASRLVEGRRGTLCSTCETDTDPEGERLDWHATTILSVRRGPRVQASRHEQKKNPPTKMNTCVFLDKLFPVSLSTRLEAITTNPPTPEPDSQICQ